MVYRDEEGKVVRVPLHECEIAEGEVVLASFKQDGWFVSPRFYEGFLSLMPEDPMVSDLGPVMR